MRNAIDSTYSLPSPHLPLLVSLTSLSPLPPRASDTLLAMLQDVSHAAGNISVIVTGEVARRSVC